MVPPAAARNDKKTTMVYSMLKRCSVRLVCTYNQYHWSISTVAYRNIKVRNIRIPKYHTVWSGEWEMLGTGMNTMKEAENSF